MQNKISKYAKKLNGFLSSDYFFWFIIFLFVFQALWIALSFRYNMLYDEYYHFGLTEYFSHQWLPWIKNQPLILDLYGLVERNPYLMFHYLLSFPFRIVDLFTDNFALQVVSMRVINIGLFTTGLIIFNRLFKEMKIRSIFRNITLLFFVLLPITPFVAATVNYDNAVFLLTALFMITGLRIIQSDNIKWQNYLFILLIGMVGSLIKNAFLPIFAAGFIFLIINQSLKYKKQIIKELKRSLASSSVALKITALVPLIIIGFLFIEKFGVNIAKYNRLSPDCASIIGKERCSNNFVQKRGYDLLKFKSGTPVQLPQYMTIWFKDMQRSLMITGVNTRGGLEMGSPLPLSYLAVFFVTILAFIGLFYGIDKIKKIPGFCFIMSIITLYLLALLYSNISAYYKYYQPIAIQGRYLLPLLPILIIWSIYGLNYLFKNQQFIKYFLLIIILALYLNGAGILTHIARSDENWNWDNPIIIEVNDTARMILKPLVLEQWYDR